jgi:hypothetical protein
MVVWAGSGNGDVSDAGFYDVGSRQWRIFKQSESKGGRSSMPYFAGSPSDSAFATNQRIFLFGSGGAHGWYHFRGMVYDVGADTPSPFPEPPVEPHHDWSLTRIGARHALWGGFGDESRVAIFNPEDQSWRLSAPIPIPCEPGHSAVAAGTRLFVWGGSRANTGGPGPGAGGFVYDPGSDRAERLPESGLHPRFDPELIWTGNHVIVWGGLEDYNTARTDGAVYDLSARKWTRMAEFPLKARQKASMHWIGYRFLVWGGGKRVNSDFQELYADGALYDPTTNAWTTMSPCPLPARQWYASAWTGKYLIFWGGQAHEGTWPRYANGALYDPRADRWMKLPESPLEARCGHSMVVSGRGVIIWGGQGEKSRGLADGAFYEPPP